MKGPIHMAVALDEQTLTPHSSRREGVRVHSAYCMEQETQKGPWLLSEALQMLWSVALTGWGSPLWAWAWAWGEDS